MDQVEPAPDSGLVKSPAWLLVSYSFLSVLFCAMVLPFVLPSAQEKDVRVPPTTDEFVVTMFAAVVSTCAFIQCPRHRVIPKVLMFLLLWPGLFFAVNCVVEYLMSRW